MILDTAVSACSKALDRLAHSRYSRPRRFSFQACSSYNPISRFPDDPRNTLRAPRMILSSQISPDPRNQTYTKCTTAGVKLTRKLPTSGAARQKPSRVSVRHFRDWLYANECSTSPGILGFEAFWLGISDSMTARQIGSARSWLGSYLGQYEVDVRR